MLAELQKTPDSELAEHRGWAELFSGPLGPALGTRIAWLFATNSHCSPEQRQEVLAALDPDFDPQEIIQRWAEQRLLYFQQLLADPEIRQLEILSAQETELLQRRFLSSREMLNAEDGNREQFIDQLQTDISAYQFEIDGLYENENEQTAAQSWPFEGLQFLTEGLLATVRGEPEELEEADDLRYFNFALEYLTITPGSPRGQLFTRQKEAWQQAETQWLLTALAGSAADSAADDQS